MAIEGWIDRGDRASYLNNDYFHYESKAVQGFTTKNSLDGIDNINVKYDFLFTNTNPTPIGILLRYTNNTNLYYISVRIDSTGTGIVNICRDGNTFEDNAVHLWTIPEPVGGFVSNELEVNLAVNTFDVTFAGIVLPQWVDPDSLLTGTKHGFAVSTQWYGLQSRIKYISAIDLDPKPKVPLLYNTYII